jgi:hypothetical protein
LAAAFKTGLREQMANAPIIPDEVIGKLDELGDDFTSFGKKLLASIAEPVAAIYDLIKMMLELVGSAVVATGSGMIAMSEEVKKNFNFTDLLNPLGMLTKLGGAGKIGAKQWEETMTDAMQGFNAKAIEAEEARKKRKDVAKGLLGAGEEDENKKERHEREKTEQEILKLRAEAARITQETALIDMTSGERILEIQRRINLARSEIADAWDDKDEAESRVNLAKLEKELAQAQKSEAKEQEQELARARKASHVDTNALQKIGAYVSSFEMDSQRIAQRSETHLENIRAGIVELVANTGTEAQNRRVRTEF